MQSEQSLGTHQPTPAVQPRPADAGKPASPHLQDRNMSMEASLPPTSNATPPAVLRPLAFVGIDLAKDTFQAAAHPDDAAGAADEGSVSDRTGVGAGPDAEVYPGRGLGLAGQAGAALMAGW